MLMKPQDEARAPAQAPNPAKYEVLVSFKDDDGAVYWAGRDVYPHDGHIPTEGRIAFLQSKQTSFKRPVISGKAKQ